MGTAMKIGCLVINLIAFVITLIVRTPGAMIVAAAAMTIAWVVLGLNLYRHRPVGRPGAS